MLYSHVLLWRLLVWCSADEVIEKGADSVLYFGAALHRHLIEGLICEPVTELMQITSKHIGLVAFVVSDKLQHQLCQCLSILVQHACLTAIPHGSYGFVHALGGYI